MTPAEPTPIDDRLLAALLAADAAVADSTGPHGSPGRSWLGDCLRVLEAAWPGAAAGAARSPGEPAPAFGRFEVVRELGRGGFGIVYLARDPVLGREVALKVPLPERLPSAEVRRRFMREARASATLDHPNIVPVFEADELGPCAYIASAYCDGPSLSGHLKARAGPVPPRDAAGLIAAVARGVQHAHDRGILHRDLKPSNVMLQPAAGSDASAADLGAMIPRLTDFGLAKLADDDGEETRSGVPLGSPPYMAPEQAAGRPRDLGPATDVYALGATLYEVLTGRAPFRGETPSETIRQVIEQEPVSPRALRPDLPRDLETICLRCLHKEPGRRYRSAAAMAEDLERFLAGRPILARPASTRERVFRWARRHPAMAAAAAVATIVAASAAAGMAWSNAWLRAHNERLEREIERANHHARESERRRQIVERREALADRHLHAAQLRLARQACDVLQVERAQEILLDDVYGPGPRHRDFAWRYLWRTSRRRVALLGRHEAPVRCVAVSPDGRTLASGDAAGGLILRDADSGRTRAVLAGHGGAVDRLAFSPDGRVLASAGRRDRSPALDDDVAIWDVDAGRPLARADGAVIGWIDDLAILDGGRVLVVVSGNPDATRTVRAWEMAAGAAPRPGYQIGGLGAVATRADGRWFAAREADGRLTLRDAATGRVARLVSDREPDAGPLAASPDGRSLAAASTGRVLIWDLGRGGAPRSFDDDPVRPDRLRFAPDGGTLVAVAEGRQVAARDLASGRNRVLLALAPGRVGTFDLDFSPDGRLLAVRGYAQPGGAIRASVWRLATGEREHVFPGRTTFERLAFARDGDRLFLGGDHDVSAWRLRPDAEPVASRDHRAEVWAVAVAPDGRSVASGADDGLLRVWDPATGRDRIEPMRHPATVSAVAYRPDGRALATGCLESRDGVRLWDADTGRLLARLAGHADRVRSVAFSPDGRVLASAGSDRTVRLWDAATGAPRAILDGHEEAVRQVAFSPDGRTLASASNDRTVRIWDADDGRCREVLPNRYQVTSLAFAPGGGTLAWADESGFIALWDPAARSRRLVINADDEEVRALAFSPDGQTLASAGASRTVRIWDPVTGQELLGLGGSRGQVNSLAFTPDGHTLLSADHAGAVRLHRGAPD